VATDVNGDHKVDLVIGDPADNKVLVLAGNGDGTFQPPTAFNTGDDAFAIAVADVNRDGIPDIVTASFNAGSISILLGNGDGSFRAPMTYPTNANSLTAIVVADSTAMASRIWRSAAAPPSRKAAELCLATATDRSSPRLANCTEMPLL
jgi:hypothetical protein